MERAGRKAGSGIKKNRHRGMYVLRCFLWHAPAELGEYDKSRYYSRPMCAGAGAFRPLWARRRLNLSAIRLRSEKQCCEASEKPPLAQ